MKPSDKYVIYNVVGRSTDTGETVGDITLNPLTAEVLRDIARNDSCSWEWRKAAVKLLIDRKHKYQNHSDLRELKEEIVSELVAEQEVQAAVESAIEESL